MGATDLTTVGAVQSYLGVDPTINAPLFQQLVSAASLMALTRMGRNILSQSYTEKYDGTGTDRLMLAQWPITAVSLVQTYAEMVNPLTIPPAPNSQSYGYVIDRNLEMLDFIGGSWRRGRQNITVGYTAGYADGVVAGEPVNIPATPGPYTATLLQGANLRAMTSLTFNVGGAALVQVGSSPISGQYTLNPAGMLGFAAADQGKALTAAYTTNGTPADLNMAIVQWVAWTYEKRKRIDQKSQTLATQTVAYDLGAMPSQTALVVDSYTRPFAV